MVREMVQECRANGRWIGRSARDARPCAERQDSLGQRLACLSVRLSATGLPSRAEHPIHPLPVDTGWVFHQSAKWNARRRTPHATVPPVKSLKQGRRYALSPSHYLFAVVFLLRLIVLMRLTGSAFLLPNSGDMHFYNEWAQRILHGQVTEHHAFYGLPLYPYLLASLYALFGYSPFIPGFLQAILDGGTAVLLYKLAVKIFSSPAPPGHPAVAGPQNRPRNFFKRYRGECIGVLA